MQPHYVSQTESSLNKALPPAKLKEKIQEFDENINEIQENLEKQTATTSTLEKHNALLLRQVDSLRSIFEKFYEEIMTRIGKIETTIEERVVQAENTLNERMRKIERSLDFMVTLEKASSTNKRLRAEILDNIQDNK